MSLRLHHRQGIPYALSSALFLGIAPIFGKQAILLGMSPLAVVALRTLGAAGLLLLAVLVFRRQYLFIYPVGLFGCLIAGTLNGIGSILYYSGLARVDASLGQLLYSMYPLFVAVLLFLDGINPSKITLLRLLISFPAVFLLTQASSVGIDLYGAAMMIGAGFFYALHIPINQRVLYEAPAPTVTLYTLFAMAGVVVPTYLIFSPELPILTPLALGPVIGLTLVTFLSRIALFAGVKYIGGLQTALLGLTELLVTIFLAHLLLKETLSLQQWFGAGLLMAALLLVGRDPGSPEHRRWRGWLHWLIPPSLSQTSPDMKHQDLALFPTAS